MDERLVVPARGTLELLEEQLGGLSAWHRDRQRRVLAMEAKQATREQRLDAQRRMEGIRRAHAALVARTAMSMEQTFAVLDRTPVRGMLANRSEWMRQKLTQGLQAHGLDMICELEDGAEALGVAIIEQPDVLIIEDRLPSMTGLDVVRAVRELCPSTLIAAQVGEQGGVAAMLDAGASVVVSRNVSPSQLVEHVLDNLKGRYDASLSS